MADRREENGRFFRSPDIRITCACGRVRVYKQSTIDRLKMPYRCSSCTSKEKGPKGAAVRWGKK